MTNGGQSRREFLHQSGVVVAGAVFASASLLRAARLGTASATAPESEASSSWTTVAEAAVSRPAMRGLMVDAARVPEKLEYYRRLIEFCAEWGFNTLHFRLADDQGSALRFATVHGLITHRNAFAPEQMRELAEYGQHHGVDVFPEIESFGHTGYITRSPTFAHLLDRDPAGSAEFSGVSPVDPATLGLMRGLYAEVASIFPSIYLHGGCDEVNWGGSARSRQALQARSRAAIWADYLNALNQIAVDLHKELIVWSDYVVHKEPQVLGLLDKRIVVMDWNYAEMNAAPLKATMEKIVAHGTRAIGAPALSCYRWGPRAGTEQLRDVDAFADAYLGVREPGALGVVVTNWVPSRYIQNSIWDCFAYAGIALNQGGATAQASGFQRFVEKHYQTSWNEQWREIFDIITSDAPSWSEETGRSSSHGLRLLVPWSSDAQLMDVVRSGRPVPNPFTRLSSLLVLAEPSVLNHLADFHAFGLCVQYLERMFWREAVVAEEASRRYRDLTRAALLIQEIAARDQALADALTHDWNMGRFADAPAASQMVTDLQPKDQMLFQWRQAARYSAELARKPDRFYTLLQE